MASYDRTEGIVVQGAPVGLSHDASARTDLLIEAHDYSVAIDFWSAQSLTCKLVVGSTNLNKQFIFAPQRGGRFPDQVNQDARIGRLASESFEAFLHCAKDAVDQLFARPQKPSSSFEVSRGEGESVLAHTAGGFGRRNVFAVFGSLEFGLANELAGDGFCVFRYLVRLGLGLRNNRLGQPL
jgi:hypothetical protein